MSAFKSCGRGRPKESEFQAQVVKLAQLRGWRVAHFRTVRVQGRGGGVHFETPVAADGKGYPDLVMLRGARQVVAELKIPPNTTTQEQDAWLADYRAAGAETFVWTPEQWPEIERVLSDER